MSDMDRFAEFLRREAKGYNEAPDVPGKAMWRGVEGGLGEDRESDDVAESAVGAGWEARADRVADVEPVDALGYNEAPSAPREEMWGRIEAALPRRRRVAGWVAGLAAAASLVLGLALGRNVEPSQPGEVVGGPVFATVPAETTPPTQTAAEAPQPAPPAEPEPQVLASGVLPSPGASVGRQSPAVASLSVPGSQAVRFVEATLTEPTGPFSNRPALRRDREQLRFFGRAETLLTALRTDQRTPLTERDLAAWGRELLIETRMHLDLHEPRSPAEFALLEDRKLLEDLELLMLQISRLGSGATDVEWKLARESIDIKNALPRLRAATDADGQ